MTISKNYGTAVKKILTKIIFAMLVVLCTSHYLHAEQSDEEDIRIYNTNKKRAKILIGEIIESKSSEDIQETLQSMRNSISAEIVISDDIIPRYRSQFYAEIYDYLRKNKDLSTQNIKALWDILSEGIVNDNVLYQKKKNIFYLSELITENANVQFSDAFINNIENAFKNKSLHDRYMILLIVYSKSPIADEVLQKYSKTSPKNLSKIFDSPEWAAKLIMAKNGDINYTNQIITLSEAANEIERFSLLFNDISSVRNIEITKYLQRYLISNERLPQLKPQLPGELIASKAAVALSKMLVGFPLLDNYNNENNLNACRKWMKEQKEYKFK